MKTTDELSVAGAGAAARFLLVTAEGLLRVHRLPDVGFVVIGRDAGECNVVIDHPKVSRRHARLEVGEICTFTDLGSRNGTLYRGQRLAPDQPQEMQIGESFSIGPLSLMLLPAGVTYPVTQTGTNLRVVDPAASAPSPLLTAIARAPTSVLISGETGVGKEVLAATLHRLSGRKGQLLAVNCAAVSENLLESELFGHERGAFTGAVQAKPGLLEAAAGGTVFLDEVGEMTPALQAKLLRATEAREVLRVGGVKAVAIDVRFLAATHRDLLMDSSGFRRDLYYRLAAVTLVIPPLRERRERIGALAVELLGRDAPAISAEATAKLVAHDWPGNVRELRNVLDRARLLSQGKEIGPGHILFDARPTSAPVAAAVASAPAAAPAVVPVDPAEAAERQRIVDALDACAGNQTRAAEMLGISRATLVHKLAVHRIPRPRKR